MNGHQQQALTALNKHLHAPQTRAMLADLTPITLAHNVPAERVISNVYRVAIQSPDILKCSPESIVRAAAEGASAGLVPGRGITAEGYIVPFKGEAQWITSYRGLIILAHRAKQISQIRCGVIMTGDALLYRDLKEGEQPPWGMVYPEQSGFDRPRHYARYGAERGDRYAVYCVARYANGLYDATYMSPAEIQAIANNAPHRGKSKPWQEHWDEMAKKTALRRAAKTWPLSIEELSSVMHDLRGEGYKVVDADSIDGATVATTSVKVEEPSSQRFLSKLQQGNGNEPPPHDEQTGEVAEQQAPPQPDLSFEERAAQHAQEARE